MHKPSYFPRRAYCQLIAILILALAGCSGPQLSTETPAPDSPVRTQLVATPAIDQIEQQANALFVTAYQRVEAARDQGTPTRESAELYSEALMLVDRILTEYPSSQIAIELVKGETKLGPYALSEFRETVVPQAQERAALHNDIWAATQAIIDDVPNPEDQVRVLTQLTREAAANNQAERSAQLLSKAVERASVIPKSDESGKSWARKYLVDTYIALSRPDEAYETATFIEMQQLQTDAYVQIGRAYADTGAYARAIELADQAHEVAAQPSSGNSGPPLPPNRRRSQNSSSAKSRVLASIVEAYAKDGQFEQAFAIVDTIPANPEGPRDSAFAGIAVGYAKADQSEQAMQTVTSISSPFYQAIAHTESAKIYVERQQPEQAVRHLDQLKQVLQGLDTEQQAWFLDDSATLYAKMNSFDEALANADQIHNLSYRAVVLARIASLYAVANQHEKAVTLFGKAVQMATDHPESSEIGQASTLRELAHELATAGQYKEALEVAQHIKEMDMKAQALGFVAITSTHRKDELNEEALSVLDAIVREMK